MRALLAIALALATLPAAAQTFPARSGESGLGGIPDAEVVGPGQGLLGADLRLDGGNGGPLDLGPLPLYAVTGLSARTEAGVTVREGGQPGDSETARVLFGGALKLQLRPATARAPAFALDATVDRLNGAPVLGSRLVASTTARANALRLAAYLGGEYGDGSAGLTWGAAIAVRHRSGVQALLEGAGGPRGETLGLSFRRQILPTTALSLGASWLPDDGGFRVTLGFGFGAAPRPAATAPVAAPAVAPAAEEEATPAAIAMGDRPRFRLRLPGVLEGRTRQHGPWAPPAAQAGGVPQRTGPRVAAPSAEDLLAAQLAEQEGLVEARTRRLAATEKQLETRLRMADTDAERLDGRERSLGEREAQLDARERRLVARGAPTREQRQLESQEAQLTARERQLAAEARSLEPAIEAAAGREADAATREDQERQETNRLSAALSGQSRAGALDVRRQLLATRGRQLAATENRLVAMGERIDAVERQLRARDERLDTWQRRLDTRAERLTVVEKRSAAVAGGPEQLGPRPEKLGDEARAQKDKAVFVMVVKSPTAILKAPAAGGAAVPPLPSGEAIRPGAAVEKAVAAATVITFATPAAKLGELDAETLDGIAKLAARENAEVLVWARAKDPSLVPEAQRRAQEIRARIAAAGPVSDRRIVTRITTRPGAQGVDVVVSALRDGAPPPVGAPAPGQPAAPAAGVADRMLVGETARRRLREAVIAAQPWIEACVGDHLADTKLVRAEGTLELTVDATGKVVGVTASDGDLAGAQLEDCLRAAAPSWKFPPAEGEYVVDVPITVILGGPAR